MAGLTRKQAAVLRFISIRIQRHGEAPTQREIQQKFGFGSKHTVRCHLAALRRKNAIRIRETMPRGIEVVEVGQQ
ncbi:MAG: LexA family transcriptional regulator [Planctomycetaceae bacterium]|nr:LexA family transcriptional regulator [Planctomycetaceae bacterium]